jgi:uncharacterized damage-inducible protein DinB
MDKAFFSQAFAYNRYANEKLIQPCLASGTLPPRARAIISHMLQAQYIWVSRINPEFETSGDPWLDTDPDEWLPANATSFTKISDILDRYEGAYDRKVHYRNSKGTSFTNTIAEILHHLLYHGAYHRGQLAMLLRDNGEQPPVTDYIFYLRE